MRWRGRDLAADPWRAAAAGVVLLGAGVRLAAAYPVHKFPADADALGAGLCIDRVLRGETPVFYHPGRIGSLECHLGAPLLLLAGGPSRAALALLPVLVGALLLVVYHRWALLVLGRPLALLALLFLAVPAPAVLFWTYMPNSYGTLLLLCAAILWLGGRIERESGPGSGLALGAAAGLGLWHSLLTLPCSLPAVAAAVARRRPPPLWLAVLAAGTLLGGAPLLVYYLRYRLPFFGGNFGAEPIAGGAALADNLLYLLRVQLPELVASMDPEGDVYPPGALVRALRWPVVAVHAAALLALLALPLWRRRPAGVRVALLWPVACGVVLLTAASYALSSAGSLRGINVRYVLPLYLLFPVALALLLAWSGARRRPVAAALAAFVLVFNLAAYRWPHHPRRQLLRARAAADRALIAELARRDVDVLLGSHWSVLPIAWLSGETVRMVPCEEAIDRDVYLERLPPDGPYRWAVAGGWEGEPALAAWLARLEAPAELVRVESYVVGLPSRPLRDREEVRRALAACPVPAPGP